jgi:hypothetical protein
MRAHGVQAGQGHRLKLWTRSIVMPGRRSKDAVSRPGQQRLSPRAIHVEYRHADAASRPAEVVT